MPTTKEHRLIYATRGQAGQNRLGVKKEPSTPVNPRSSAGQSSAKRVVTPGVSSGKPATVGGTSPRRGNFVATPQSTIDPNRGIRPGQFGTAAPNRDINTPVYFGATEDNPYGTGEISHYNTTTKIGAGGINEQAGEYIKFERGADGRDIPIKMGRDKNGNPIELERYDPVDTPDSRTMQGRSGTSYQDPRSGAMGQAGAGGYSSFSGGRNMLSVEQQQKNLQQLQSQTPEERAKAAGIDTSNLNLMNALSEAGLLKDAGGYATINGKLTLNAVTPEQMQLLRDKGIQFKERLTGDDNNNALGYRNITFSVNETEFVQQRAAMKDIMEGKDIQQAGNLLNQLQEERTMNEQAIREGQAYQRQQEDMFNQQPEQTPQATGAGAAIANLPPEAQFLVPYLQQYQQDIDRQIQENKTFEEQMLGKQQESYDTVDAQLSEIRQSFTEATNEMKGLIEEARAQQEQSLAVQKKAAEERLAWDDLQARRRLTKQKAEAHQTLVVQIALAGGAAQDAGTAAVMASDAKFDSEIEELAVNMSFARTDLAAKYSALYMENQNNYINASMQNMKDLRGAMERIGMQGIANQQARSQAEQTLLSKHWDNEVALRQKKADTTLSIAEKIQAEITAQDKREREAKETAWNRMIETFQKFPAGSTMRSLAVKKATEAGWDTSEIDVNEVTIDALAKKEEAEKENLYDITPYLNDDEKFGLITSALTISNLAVRDQVDNVYASFKKLIDAGETKKAISFMKNFAVANMTAGIKQAYSDRNTIVKSTGTLLAKLDKVKNTGQAKKFFDEFGKLGEKMNERANKAGGFEGLTEKDFNWYTKELQNLRNKLGIDKNPELQEVYAEVENIAGIIINDRYGAAVTDGEMARAREYIAMSGNTLEDMKSKMRVFAKFSAQQNREALSSQGLNIDFLIEDFDATLPLTDDEFTIEPTDDELKQMLEEMDQDFEKLGEFSYNGRSMVSKEYAGRKVTLSKPVMTAFHRANQEFKRDYGADIRIGGEQTSSFRDQKETIRQMAERAGIPFNEVSPNVTARMLREKGMQVANVGASKHERGEAIDLYPFEIVIDGISYQPNEYIALVKPYLERYGIKQVNHRGLDPGNFEYSIS